MRAGRNDIVNARDARIEVISLPDGEVEVRLWGDHDLSTKSRLTEALAGVRRASGVVIDLTNCTFVDSTIIAAVLHALDTHAEPPRVSVRLPDDTSYVYRAFSVAGVRELLPLSRPVDAERGAEPPGG
jgi:STAS domain-containing protein